MKTRTMDLLIIVLALIGILLVVALRAEDYALTYNRPTISAHQLVPDGAMPLVATWDNRILALTGVEWRHLVIPTGGDTLRILALVPTD